MMKISPEAIKYILLQRTQFNKHSTPQEIEGCFREDFETYAKYLPKKCESIVDIGCGIGIQNIPLLEKYPNAELLMIDKTKTEENIWYGYQNEGAFYNNLELAYKTMIDNKFTNVRMQQAKDGLIAAPDNSVDLVTSFISWGFHYPVETYLKEVIRVMKPGATLIVDVRHNTNGIVYLSSEFECVIIINCFEKYSRVICKKVV